MLKNCAVACTCLGVYHRERGGLMDGFKISEGGIQI